MRVKGKNEKLFNLIKSLTRSEKRYFNLFSQRHVIGEKNKYQQLFQMIEKQKSYDEQKILMSFKKKGVKLNISSEKNYLYNLILRSLRSFYAETDERMKMEHLKMDVYLLIERGLFREADQRLAQLKKISERNEDSSALLDIWINQHRLNSRLQKSLEADDFIKMEEAGDLLINRISERKVLIDIYQRLYYFYQRRQLANVEDETNEVKSYKDKLSGFNSDELDIESKIIFLNSQLLVARILKEPERSEKANDALVEMVETHPSFFKNDSKRAIAFLYNAYSDKFAKENIEGAKQIIDKIEAFAEASGNNSEIAKSIIIKANSGYYLNVYDYDKVIDLEKDLGQLELRQDDKLTIYYNIALAHFFKEDFNAMLDWINNILLDKKTSYREDIQSVFRVFNLVCHYEQNNAHYLDSLIRKTLRNIKSTGAQMDFEKIIIQFMKKSGQFVGKSDRQEEFEKLNIEIDSFENHRTYLIGYSAIRAWVKSRLEGENIESAYRQLMKKNNI